MRDTRLMLNIRENDIATRRKNWIFEGLTSRYRGVNNGERVRPTLFERRAYIAVAYVAYRRRCYYITF